VASPSFGADTQLAETGENPRALLNLRKRMGKIRVFDPACGSGNFLVIAYKQMREIEAQINRRRGESDIRSEIPLTNFRGIELRDFPAEIARLALVIAEYQCDVLYRGQKLALAEFLPLRSENWITCGNALRLDWLSICPPTGIGVKLQADDLFSTPLDQAEIDFANKGGETYICGNPPYVGDKYQTKDQKDDLKTLTAKDVRAVDYIAGWFWKASDYIRHGGRFAFVSTNSICQGVQVPLIWQRIIAAEQVIFFGHKDFLWGNNAAKNAQVATLATMAEGTTLQEIQDRTAGGAGALGDLREWAERKYRMKGQVRFSAAEISAAADRILQSRRAFLPSEHRGIIRAMTISQAKNREFEGVIVLWPFAIGGDLDSQRRRLYNALTRAHSWAVVIVQDDARKASRLLGPPFSKQPQAVVAKKNGTKAE